MGQTGPTMTEPPVSDSGWLATLPGLSAAAVEHQVRWLGTLLAARGMPRLLMEEHLVVLHDELCRALPERSGDYASLLDKSLARVGWDALERDVARRRGAGEYVGLGLAVFVDKSGLGPADGARVAVHPNGDVEAVWSGSTASALTWERMRAGRIGA